MTPFEKSLRGGRFTLTVELSPPKGTDVSALIENTRSLLPHATAFNVTDNQSAVMHLSSLGAARLVRETGGDAILQVTGRDRNRLALQSDLLAASVLGIGNVLSLTGDHVTCGDHPGAKPVFDLDSVHILQAVRELNEGRDLAGNSLQGATELFSGAAVAPEYEPFDLQWLKFEKKMESGAEFFQTQAVFSPGALERLVKRASALPVYILAGVLLLKSPAMASYINRRVPGLNVPENIVQRLAEAADPLQEGMSIAAEQIARYRDMCHGVHLMTAGREDLAAKILGMT
jgi:5,10-methylenetetrahydrofolate reductase